MIAEKDLLKVEEIVSEVISDQSLEKGDILINCLHEIQNSFCNFVPPEAAEKVAQMLEIPVSSVYEVLTFYTMFATKKRGKYVIRMCDSLPCHVTGGREVVDALREELGIDINQTTSDGLFTLETTGCLGLCGVSPAIMVNDQFYGNLKPSEIKPLIEKIKKEGGDL